jgi:lipid-A-disaccharide synthase
VKKILPVLLESARKILARRPGTRFEIAAASDALAGEIERTRRRFPFADRVRVVTGDSSGTMQRAFVGMVASGTATLESAYFRMPFVLVYKVSWPTYFAARLMMRTRFLGMPNVLADREIVPEFLQHEARPRAIADALLHLVDDSTRRQEMVAEFDAIIAKLGETGASEKAARAILDELGR